MSPEAHIRPGRPDDLPALADLAAETGMFSEGELEFFRGMMEETLGAEGDGAPIWALDTAAGLRGAAFAATEEMGEGVWNLYFIGTAPDHRRQGVARGLLAHVEAALGAQGVRLLLVETSSGPDQAAARALYPAAGYDEEARIRDFYAMGQDKIIYRKRLN